MTELQLPPVTDAHRRAAFEGLRLKVWSYEAALLDATLAKVIEARAHQLRTRDYQASHSRSTALVRRHNPATGAWCTQRVAGPYIEQKQEPLA
ncbi:MAG: hypothetical protein ACRECD_13980 [Burkholderiaceae bacterium]